VKVLAQLTASGYAEYFLVPPTEEDGAIRGVVRMDRLADLIAHLHNDQHFACGIFHGLHEKDVGHPRIEFRSHTGTLGKGSLQWVINRETGQCYCDVDRFSPYSDLVGIVGHLFGEVIFGGFKRRWRRNN
jgi:hypothetical protein